MRRSRALCLCLALGLVTPLAARARVVAVAVAQDDWRLSGLAGGALSRADVAQGTAVIVVWASWSPKCQDIVERTNRLTAKWAGRARVVLVDFQEDAGEVSAFLAGKGAQAPSYLDREGAFAKAHGVATLPGLVVYHDGAVAYQGRLPDDADKVIGEVVQ